MDYFDPSNDPLPEPKVDRNSAKVIDSNDEIVSGPLDVVMEQGDWYTLLFITSIGSATSDQTDLDEHHSESDDSDARPYALALLPVEKKRRYV